MKGLNYLLSIITLITIHSLSFAEGTKEFWPDPGQETRILIAKGNIGGQQRDPFAVFNGAVDYRLYIHIQDPLVEKIYFGIGERNGSTVIANGWRIHQPDGTVIYQGSVPTTGQGFIDTYDKAIRGPTVLDPLGYDALVLDLGIGFPSGDYYMTFDINNNSSRSFKYFDITVVNSSTVTAKPGRVFSKNWQFSNPSYGPGSYYFFKGLMFIYSLDGIVTKLNPNGFEGRDFSFSCNESGCYPIGPTINAQQARRSQPGPNPHTYPQYKIFLNNPDPNVYPDGVIGQLVAGSVTTETFCSSGTVNFNFQTTPLNAVGTVEILLSLSTLIPPMVDRILITNNVPGGNYTIVWDGKDGAGNQVPSGSTFPFTLRYTNGLTHMPLWDVENNQNGFIVNLIRPVTVPPLADPAFYWDDMLVAGTQMLNPPGCTTPPATSCHDWSGSWGDQKTINTWWYLVSNSTENVNVTYKRGPSGIVVVNPPAGVCPGGNITIFANADPNSSQYNWEWDGGSQITTVPTVSITYPLSATPGTTSITVNGINAICGSGPVTTVSLMIYSLPNVTVSGPVTACLNDTKNYTTQAGMTGYQWNVSAGGSIVSGGGTSAVSILWTGSGNQTISVNYTTPDGCSIPTPATYTVNVNPLPVPAITGNSEACQGSAGNVYATAAGHSNYTWSISSGGTIISGGTSLDNTATVTWNTVGPQTISAGYTDGSTGCNSAQPTVYNVTVKPLPVPVITGNNEVCEGTTNVIYTTGSGHQNYTWIISPGGTITSGGTTTSSSVTVTWNTQGNQSVSLNYTDGATGCTALAPSVLNVTVKPLPDPALSGPLAACLNAPGPVYTTDAGMSAYTWNIIPPGAGTITSGSGTNSIEITWNATGNQSISINYTAVNGCAAATPTIRQVLVNSLPVPTLSGLTTICTGVATTYSTEPGMQSYAWNVSAGGTINSGGGVNDNTVNVTWNSPTPQTVSVNYVVGTGCQGAAPTIRNVTVNQSTPMTLTGNNSVCEGSGAVYTTETGMTNYTWGLSSGGTITAGGGPANNTVTINWTTAGSWFVTVNFTNGFGCTAAQPTQYNITVNPLPVTTISASAGPDCELHSRVFQTPADPGSVFTWSLIPASSGNVALGQGTNVATIGWLNWGAATIAVTGTNITTGCLTSSTFGVTVYPSPVPAFTACFDLVTTPNARKFTLRGGFPYITGQGVYSGNRVTYNTSTGFYEFDPFGAPTGIYPITYTFTNNYGCNTITSPVNITIQNNAFFCGTEVTDVRDNQRYETTLLGGRCWMKKNLNWGTILAQSSTPQTDNCVAEKYCLPSDPNCTAYGGLYQWDELMRYETNSINQGICPPEWHVPTESEWQLLINAIGAGITPPADGIAGSFLKDAFLNPGFYALIEGICYMNNAWSYTTGSLTGGMFWTSTPGGADRSVARGVNSINPSASRYAGNKANAFSVRCVKD